jgi:hypothetical protein
MKTNSEKHKNFIGYVRQYARRVNGAIRYTNNSPTKVSLYTNNSYMRVVFPSYNSNEMILFANWSGHKTSERTNVPASIRTGHSTNRWFVYP